MKRCPFCAEDVQDAAIVCKHCGRDLAPTADKPKAGPFKPDLNQELDAVKRNKGILIALGLFLGVGLLASTGAGLLKAVLSPRKAATPPLTRPTPTKEALVARAQAIEAQRKKNVADGLAETRKLVAVARLCEEPKGVADAWAKLKQAKKSDAEWDEAKRATLPLEKCRKRAELTISKGMRLIMVAQREQFAKTAEKKMLDQGMEMDFVVAGTAKNQLTLKWPLMGKVAVHQMTNDGSMAEGSFLANLQKVGFKRVAFRNGYNFDVYYDLAPADESKGGAAVLQGLGIGEPLTLE